MKYTLLMLRARDELKQSDAAEKVGVSVLTWQRWEKHITIPNAERAHKIAEAFNVKIDDIKF